MGVFEIYLFSLSLLVGVSILVLRLFVRRDYLQRGRLSMPSAMLQALIFFAYGGFPAIYLPNTWPASQVTHFLRIIALTILFIGLAIMLNGIYQLGLLRSLGIKTGVIKDSSQYRFTRNPQVLGCVIYMIGFVILWPSWFALGWGLSLILILHVMVLTEEEHLHNTYGQVYEQYCQRVPRYLRIPRNR